MKTSYLLKRIFSKSFLNKLEIRIKMLGPKSKVNINNFLYFKIALLLIVFILLLICLNMGYIVSPICTIILYFLYDYLVLDINIKKRASTLEHDAIFFFEILNLSLQSEKNLKICLENTTKAIDSEISDEFKIVLKEVKLGKSLNEALNDMKEIMPSKNVQNVLLNIIESNTYGTNIISSLDNQVEYLLDKRILDIKEKINKIPTKISIVSVLLFIPLIMLLILGPIAITYLFK